ncbi:hypothetical protein [Micromonospora tulbaghiae]|uniref:hypothetical protein n=1 Tax=Micromonospora tulbaghiae TaxID=479978 RepID=UPI0034238DAE
MTGGTGNCAGCSTRSAPARRSTPGHLAGIDLTTITPATLDRLPFTTKAHLRDLLGGRVVAGDAAAFRDRRPAGVA